MDRSHPVPPGVGAVVRRFLDGTVGDAEPRDSATVLVLRDGPAGVEVFLQRRSATMASGVGQYVFPGGLVDAADRAPGVPWAGPTPSRWAEVLGGEPADAQALVCAAVRETFEECGLLLAGAGPGHVVGDARRWAAERAALAAHELTFADFLAANSLVLRSDLLHAVSRWITPEWMNRRYDTRFFVTRLPASQQPGDPSSESDRTVWRPVRLAVEEYAAGRFPLMLPTAAVLREIATAPTTDAALTADYDLDPIRFRVVEDETGAVQVLTSGPGGEAPAYTIPPEPLP